MRTTFAILLISLQPTLAVAAPQQNPFSGYHDAQGFKPYLLVKKWDELSDKEKKKIKEAREKYRKLPEGEREKLREKWEKMPKKEREKYKIEKKYR